MADRFKLLADFVVIFIQFGDLDRERDSFALGVTALRSGILLRLTFTFCINCRGVRGVLGAEDKTFLVVFGRVID